MSTIEPAVLPRVRPLRQLICAGCGEKMLEIHSRRFAGQIYCQPCFARYKTRQIKEEQPQ